MPTPPATAAPGTRRLTAALVLLYWLGLSTSCIDYNIFKPDGEEHGGTEGSTDGGSEGGDDSGWGACGPPSVDVDVSVNEACVVDTEPGELDAVVEWSVEVFDSFAESDQVLMAPVVGQLTDDNGDGVIDREDTPDIVVISDYAGDGGIKHGVLRVLSGRDGSQHIGISRPTDREDQIFPYRYSNVALGDVDADGSPELVVLVEVIASGGGGDDSGGTGPMDTGDPDDPDDPGGGHDSGDNPIFPSPPALVPDYRCYLAAFDVSGSLDWIADSSVIDCAGHAPALADLDGDGLPEAIIGNLVINGEDGSLAWKGAGDEGRYYAYAEIGMHSVVADLDGDGQQEVIAGRTIYGADGDIRCTAAASHDGFAAIADLDGDDQGEVVMVGNSEVVIYDSDCSILTTWTLGGGGNGGPPALGDVDGDGMPEIALPSATDYGVYELDGTQLWSYPVSDLSSHATGSVIFDFESDGLPEVVYADEVALHIFNGQTGELRLRDERHSSRTLHDYPTVADVDNDGSVEIIVPNGGGHYDTEQRGLYVMGSESSTWQAGRQVWNQHAYSITNIGDDLSIPAVPVSNWPTHNSFRSGDPNPSSGGLWPDAVPVAQVCTEQCADGLLVIDIALANQGAGGLRAGVPVHAWYDDDGTTRTLEVTWTRLVTPEGAVSEAARIEVEAAELGGRPIYVIADQDRAGVGYAEECDEGNNMLTVTETSCD